MTDEKNPFLNQIKSIKEQASAAVYVAMDETIDIQAVMGSEHLEIMVNNAKDAICKIIDNAVEAVEAVEVVAKREAKNA